MGARETAPSLSLATRDAIERHNRVLLHALQVAQPMLYQGRKRFIHTLKFSTSGSDIDVTVYLTGSPEPVTAAELSLPPDIN